MCENPEISLKVYVGWTGENASAYEVCRTSLLACASVPVIVYPIYDWECRDNGYKRFYTVCSNGQRLDGIDGRPFSTDFSFTRFLVPALAGYADEWVLYCDSDMLFLDDVAKLFKEVEDCSAPVACVKHEMFDSPNVKKWGHKQDPYPTKGWSSLMLMKASKCRMLSYDYINRADGAELHNLSWTNDVIQPLPARWNVLHGIQRDPEPAVIHFTLGTPDTPFRAADDEWSNLWWRCMHVLRSSGAINIREMRRVINGRM